MDIKGIGNDILNTYSELGKSQESQTDFEEIFNRAIEEQDDARLQDACEEFESYYVQQLFKEMRKTVPKGGLFEESNEQAIYEDMLDEEYSKVIGENRGFGIADALYRQLSPKFKGPTNE